MHHFTYPPAVDEDSSTSPSLPTFAILCLFYYNYPIMCESGTSLWFLWSEDLFLIVGHKRESMLWRLWNKPEREILRDWIEGRFQVVKG